MPAASACRCAPAKTPHSDEPFVLIVPTYGKPEGAGNVPRRWLNSRTWSRIATTCSV